VGVHQLLHLDLCDHAAIHQPIRPQFPGRGVPGDLLVHVGLREAGFISFVVAVPPIPDEIDEEVFMKAGAIGEGQARRLEARLGVVGVDVDDGDGEALGQVAGVQGAAARRRVGGVAHLVVGDDVDCATGVITRETREIEGLGHDPLAWEGGIAVHEDG
jgi:hypothetical protein